MEKHTISISEGQYIADLFDKIPSNIILNKRLPGIRATTKEIETPRNSILLESNVPVIKDKCKKYRHYHVIGVFKNTEDDLEEYLLSKVPYKKIMVTPESYPLLMEAMRKNEIDVYNEYFLLWDECDRMIQDIYYRGRIVLPIDDVFKFKYKAFISATVIPPSDPRFDEHSFTYVELQPDFDYCQSIKLIHTNNIVVRLKEYFLQYPSEHYFIFLNSTKAIASIQKALGIKKDSFTFCAYESSLRLKLSKFPNCSTELGAFKKYNFFTSRFFSAVDIDFTGQPNIVILTDLEFAEHSKIDPYSEAVQIIGRFRKPIGSVNHVCHITNTDSNLTFKIPDQTKTYLEQHKFLYDTLNILLDGATELGSVLALREVISMMPWSKYLNEDGTINHFMVDNTFFEEKVKSYYQKVDNLREAYNTCGYFTTSFSEVFYEYSDNDRRIAEKSPLRNVARMVIQHLNKINNSGYPANQVELETQILNETFPEIGQIYNQLPFEICERLRFNIKAMQNEIDKRNMQKEKSNFEFIRTLKTIFKVGIAYSSTEIKSLLMKAINQHKAFLLTANVQLLRQYFELSDRYTIRYKEDGTDIKGYKIISCKFM